MSKQTTKLLCLTEQLRDTIVSFENNHNEFVARSQEMRLTQNKKNHLNPCATQVTMSHFLQNGSQHFHNDFVIRRKCLGK